MWGQGRGKDGGGGGGGGGVENGGRLSRQAARVREVKGHATQVRWSARTTTRDAAAAALPHDAAGAGGAGGSGLTTERTVAVDRDEKTLRQLQKH